MFILHYGDFLGGLKCDVTNAASVSIISWGSPDVIKSLPYGRNRLSSETFFSFLNKAGDSQWHNGAVQADTAMLVLRT